MFTCIYLLLDGSFLRLDHHTTPNWNRMQLLQRFEHYIYRFSGGNVDIHSLSGWTAFYITMEEEFFWYGIPIEPFSVGTNTFTSEFTLIQTPSMVARVSWAVWCCKYFWHFRHILFTDPSKKLVLNNFERFVVENIEIWRTIISDWVVVGGSSVHVVHFEVEFLNFDIVLSDGCSRGDCSGMTSSIFKAF